MAVDKDKAVQQEKIIQTVQHKVSEYVASKELVFPKEYIPANVLTASWLMLQGVTDKVGKPALEVCSRDSVMLALLDVITQGLNPVKKQGYFIVYGGTLTFQRSYFGTIHLVKTMAGASEAYAEVVYEGDIFEYKIEHGKKIITKHEQTLDSIDNTKIKAAYCVVEFPDEKRNVTQIMTFEQIKQAWKQSKMLPIDDHGNVKPGSVHGKFSEEMAKKTVINRTCKPLINGSNDSYLIAESLNRSEKNITDEVIEAEIIQNANSEVLDMDEDNDKGGEVIEAQEANVAEEKPIQEQKVEEKKASKPETKKETKTSTKKSQVQEQTLISEEEPDPF